MSALIYQTTLLKTRKIEAFALVLLGFAAGFYLGIGPLEAHGQIMDRIFPENLANTETKTYSDISESWQIVESAKQSLSQGHADKGQSNLQHLQTCVWWQPEILVHQGTIAFDSNDLAVAYHHWHSVWQNYPDTPAAKQLAGPLALLTKKLHGSVARELSIAGAVALVREKKFQPALDLLRKRQDDTTMYYRIKILNRAGKFSQAVSCAQMFLAKHPDSEWLQLVLINLAYNLSVRQRKYDEALEYYAMLLEKFPNSKRRAGILLTQGDCLVALNKLAQARASYQQVIAISDRQNLLQSASYSIATTYLWQQQTAKAFRWLKKTADYGPSNLARKALTKLENLQNKQ